MNGSGREVLVNQEVRQGICHALGFHENKSETSTMGVEDVKQNRAFVHILNILNLLGNVLRGRTNTSNRQEDIVLQEISGEHLNIAREGGREHEGLTVLDTWHIFAFHNASNLGFETHVQHAISLVKDQVFDVTQRDTATLDKVDKTAGGGDKEIAASLEQLAYELKMFETE